MPQDIWIQDFKYALLEVLKSAPYSFCKLQNLIPLWMYEFNLKGTQMTWGLNKALKTASRFQAGQDPMKSV